MDFADIKTIVVAGLTDNPEKASYRVASYLQENGFRIIPVNPTVDSVLGEKSYPDINSIPAEIPVDVVDIFRKPEAVKPYVEQAIARGCVKVIWLQEGIVNEEAASLARENGIEVVMDKCIKKAYEQLLDMK